MIRDLLLPAEWADRQHGRRPHGGADGIRIRQGAATPRRRCPRQLAGTLVLTERRRTANQAAFDVSATRSGIVRPLRSPPQTAREPRSSRAAVRPAGRPDLNLMPCVFPVLAMKAAGSCPGGHARSAMRRDASPTPRACWSLSPRWPQPSSRSAPASSATVSWASNSSRRSSRWLIAYLFFVVGLISSACCEIGSRFAGVARACGAARHDRRPFFTACWRSSSPLPAPCLHGRVAGLRLSQPAPQTLPCCWRGAGPRLSLSGAHDDRHCSA